MLYPLFNSGYHIFYGHKKTYNVLEKQFAGRP